MWVDILSSLPLQAHSEPVLIKRGCQVNGESNSKARAGVRRVGRVAKLATVINNPTRKGTS